MTAAVQKRLRCEVSCFCAASDVYWTGRSFQPARFNGMKKIKDKTLLFMVNLLLLALVACGQADQKDPVHVERNGLRFIEFYSPM